MVVHIKIAKAGRLPKITLQGSLGTGYASGGRSWVTQMGKAFNENVGVSLSIPIFDANATKRAVAKARLASFDYDLTDREQLENLAQTVESLYVESRNAREKYLAGIKQLEAAEASSALVDRQFELGLVNPLELLTAHNDLLNARLAQLQNKYMAVLSGSQVTSGLAYSGRFLTCSSVVYIKYTPSSHAKNRRKLCDHDGNIYY